MRKAMLILSFVLAAAPAAAQPERPTDRDSERILVARADGSWTITQDIVEEPETLSRETGRLVFDEGDPASREARRMRRSEEERDLEEAFEEAVEWSRRTEPQ